MTISVSTLLTSAKSLMHTRGLSILFESHSNSTRGGWTAFKKRALSLLSSDSDNNDYSSDLIALSASTSKQQDALQILGLGASTYLDPQLASALGARLPSSKPNDMQRHHSRHVVIPLVAVE